MNDPILDKLDREWAVSFKKKNYALAGKVLRARVNVLKSTGGLAEHKEELGQWVHQLEALLEKLPSNLALALIGHLRHARKSLSLTGSDIGTAFRTEISATERARYRKRNRPPTLRIADRSDLPAGYANGSPSEHLLASDLGDDAG